MEIVTGKALLETKPSKKEIFSKRRDANIQKNNSLLSLTSSPSKKKFGNGTTQRVSNNNFDLGEILSPDYQLESVFSSPFKAKNSEGEEEEESKIQPSLTVPPKKSKGDSLQSPGFQLPVPSSKFGATFQNAALSSIATVNEELQQQPWLVPGSTLQPPLKKNRIFFFKEVTENLLLEARKKQDFIRGVVHPQPVSLTVP